MHIDKKNMPICYSDKQRKEVFEIMNHCSLGKDVACIIIETGDFKFISTQILSCLRVYLHALKRVNNRKLKFSSSEQNL